MIRAATADDADAMSRLHTAARRRAYAHLGTAEQAAGAFTPQWWGERVAGSDTALVAEPRDAIAGLALVEGDLLGQLYVDPGTQGAGIGSALLAAAAVAAGATRLWVYEDNPPARRFYERHGWALVPESAHVDPAWALPVPAVEYRLADA